MKNIELIPQNLSAENFALYGDILSTNSEMKIINNGFAQKHFNLCAIDSRIEDGLSAVHIYVAKKRVFPLHINMLEKHPFFSQAFIPRTTTPFLAVVALGEDEPDLNTLKAFITDGNQGVHYKRGIWHFPLISLEENEQFIVIDRMNSVNTKNKIEECIEYSLDEKVKINLFLGENTNE
jgi:ureidoglycolate lyase